jgi:hypothetical protein
MQEQCYVNENGRSVRRLSPGSASFALPAMGHLRRHAALRCLDDAHKIVSGGLD